MGGVGFASETLGLVGVITTMDVSTFFMHFVVLVLDKLGEVKSVDFVETGFY